MVIIRYSSGWLCNAGWALSAHWWWLLRAERLLLAAGTPFPAVLQDGYPHCAHFSPGSCLWLRLSAGNSR